MNRDKLMDASNAQWREPATASPPTALRTVEATLSLARDLAIRVEGIVGRLCGDVSIGEQGERTAPAPAPNGILANMEADAECTQVFLRQAMSSIVRLEKALG